MFIRVYTNTAASYNGCNLDKTKSTRTTEPSAMVSGDQPCSSYRWNCRALKMPSQAPSPLNGQGKVLLKNPSTSLCFTFKIQAGFGPQPYIHTVQRGSLGENLTSVLGKFRQLAPKWTVTGQKNAGVGMCGEGGGHLKMPRP